ncbi:MAG TPA: Rpn family recombination-promoting nuclease/putative transposase, partial [Telluria sp.]|nr:Rpn family recombination-promoting nuclease/putative transposase [Telluria sp.]
MAGDHDTGYRQLFAHPELVRDLLAGFTSFACFRNLDALAFERVNASYVSERDSQRHDDMVWRVRLDDEWLYVYLLLEFQSASDRWMALRMQVYLGLLYQDLVKQHRLSPQG